MSAESDPLALRLEALRPTDQELFRRLYTDPASMRYIAPVYTPSAADSEFRAALSLPAQPPGVGRHRRVIRTEPDLAIGLLAIDAHRDPIELGVMLLPAWQGRGIARRIVAAALIELAESAAARVVQVQYRPDNRAMAALARALAFDSPEFDPVSGRVRQRLALNAVARFPRSFR